MVQAFVERAVGRMSARRSHLNDRSSLRTDGAFCPTNGRFWEALALACTAGVGR